MDSFISGNFAKRALTGIPLLFVLLLLVAYGHWLALGVILVSAGLFGIHEYRLLLAGGPGIKLAPVPLMAGALLIGAGGLWGGAAGLNLGLAASVMLLIAGGLGRKGGEHLATLREMALGLFGLCWIPWFLGHALLLLRMPGGNGLILFLLLVLTFTDICAYLVGTTLGRRLLLPALSPKKTVEGSLGGLAGGALGGYIALSWLPAGEQNLGMAAMMALALVVSLLGQAGDLLESLVKRAAGAKNSGSFLPGHGGFLDRLDSLLLAPPFTYYLLTYLP